MNLRKNYLLFESVRAQTINPIESNLTLNCLKLKINTSINNITTSKRSKQKISHKMSNITSFHTIQALEIIN
jgi:hypothetical protein